MRTLILAALATACWGAALLNPISWRFQDAPSKAVRPGARFTVKLVAEIERGWHLYSMKPLPDGPIPTRIWIGEGQQFELAGSVKTPPPQVVHDPNFDMEVEFYDGPTAFILPVRTAPKATAGVQRLQVSVSYQSCNDKLCLPPRTARIDIPVEIR
jgi:DsbC/DsbD-like thiol-disulfide interchange protein